MQLQYAVFAVDDEIIPVEPLPQEEIVEEQPVDENFEILIPGAEPVVEELIAEEPIIDEELVVYETVAEEPVAEEPVVEEPIVEEPVAEEPVVDESVVDESIAEEPVAEEPVVDETVIDETVIDETVIDETVIDETVIDETVINETVAEGGTGDVVLLEDLREKEALEKIDEPEIQEPEIEIVKSLEEVIEENKGECSRSTVGCDVIFQEENNLIEVTYYETDEETVEEIEEIVIDNTIYETGENPIEITPPIELIENGSEAGTGSTAGSGSLVSSGSTLEIIAENEVIETNVEVINNSLSEKRKEKRGKKGFMMESKQEIFSKRKSVAKKVATVPVKSSVGKNTSLEQNTYQERIKRKEENKQAAVRFEKETQIISTYGVVQGFNDIQFEQDFVEKSPFEKEPILGSVLLGSEQDHLIFSTPVEVVIPVSELDIENGDSVQASSFHFGDEKYTTSSISTNPNATCLPDGTISDQSNIAIIKDGFITLYTCGASTFVVTYVGGAALDNFVDFASLSKTLTVGAGGAITDLNITVDFQPIDSEDPTNFGTTNAYSNEASMTIESPNSTVVSILDLGTYTNNGAANRAVVTFDDAAGAAPTNLPIDGTFLPSNPLSAFNGEDPVGDWTFTISDSANQDGIILYEVSLELTDAATCGDSTLEGAEGCDDGGTTSGDGCNNVCLIEDTFACNISGVGAEDDFGCESGVCDQTEVTPTCEAANTCGNGLLEGAEECDDGNTISGDGCSASCSIQRCSNGIIDTATAFGTIFSEDFESDNGTTQTSNTLIISGTNHTVTYENAGANGRVQYGTNAQVANGGAGAVSLDVTPTGTFVVNHLIFETDLSAFTTSTDLELSFDRTDHGDENQAEDIVEIRGSDSDSFIQVFGFVPAGAANNTYRTETVDIDAALLSAGQIPTSTFQIRFGQNDNFTIISNTANDGITLDNVEVTGTIPGPAVDETCDDTNDTAGDGCSDTCTVEPFYTCTGEPSVCTTCGNGTIEGSDVCDDGNQIDGDGCSSTCTVETNYECTGAPSICTFCNSTEIIQGTIIPSVGPSTQTINFSDFTSYTYTSTPIVIMTPVTDNNTNNYSIPVISNITTTSVTISSCVDAGDVTCDTTLNDDDFALFVIDVDGASCTDNIEAGTTNITTAGGDTAFTFANVFTNEPYVFTTPQTSNQGGNIAATAWVDDNSLSVNGGDFVGCVHQNGNPPNGGSPNIDRCSTGEPDETLGWVAIDPVLFSQTGFQLGTQNISNSNWTTTTFSPAYTDAPAVMVTQNSDNGGQDPQYAWARNTTSTQTQIRYCEADAGGVCNSHTSEIVRWFSLDVPKCGDGEILGSEICDDGNTTDGDGCSATCTVESGFACTGEPSVCTPGGGCGDGTVDTGEECDDNNTTNGDGCSDICELENSALCGNGNLNPGETCDDNNTTNGDGCSDTCQVETGFVCPSNALCGNSVIDPGEQCDDGGTADGDGCSQYCIEEFNFLLTTFTGESLVPATAPGGGLGEPIWTFDAGGYEASVSTASNPYAHVLYAPFNFWSLAAPRAVELAFQGASDDDFIGYVFGFQPGDRENPNADFLLVTWKDADQTFNFTDDPIAGGQADAGLSVVRVQGIVSYDELRQHIDSPNTSGSVTELARGTNYGNVGYTPDLYDTSVFYNTGSMDVYVNGALDISITGSFDDGRFGIFILAQAGNTFALGRPHPYALGGGCYALCGDGIEAGDEQCDDGNTTNGDGCSEFCSDETVDECALGTDNCSINATCYNSYDGFDCVCNDPFTGDGVTCTNGSNTPPTDMVLSGSVLTENNGTGDVIGLLSTTDAESTTGFIYSFGCAAPLPDEQFFSLSGDQLLAGTGFNFEIPFDDNGDNDYEICILVDDTNGGTYEETFTITVEDAYEEVCITVGTGIVFNPVTASSDSGGIIASQTFSGWFNVQDYNGSNTGWYTTLSISSFTGSLGSVMPASVAEIRNTNPIRTVSGTTNPNIVFDGGMSSYQQFATPITYIERPTGTNSGVTGEYETDPEMRLTIPPYQEVDTYTATITYTLYEN